LTTSLLIGSAGLALLYFGGNALVDGACSLALRLRVSRVVVGLTIVAFGTSAPELVVSLNAALGGANDIAVGNVVGSNIVNLALILGGGAMVRAAIVEAKLLRIDAPLMVLITLVFVGLMLDDHLSRLEGAFLVSGLLAYTGLTFRQGRRESAAVQAEFKEVAGTVHAAPWGDILRVVVGMIGLVAGGKLLVDSAVTVASSIGVSQAVIGLTIVALGTSLPELATTTIAVSKGHGDVAIGNVIGSNIFNLLGILGVTSIVSPLARGHVSWVSIGVMLGVSLLLLPMLHTRQKLSRVEGTVLVGIYVGYLVWLLAVVVPGSRAPSILSGTFEDDYGIRYTITDSTWVQHPAATYHVDRWHPDEQFLIARNDSENSYDPGLWTRIDWVELEGMSPYGWAFCLSTFDAVSADAAESVTIADPESPQTGCNGFPYSRMKRTE
jgi:cation:H+ antiporter